MTRFTSSNWIKEAGLLQKESNLIFKLYFELWDFYHDRILVGTIEVNLIFQALQSTYIFNRLGC